MWSSRITTREELHHYLYLAMQIEHATVPPYLMVLYSLYPGTNLDAFHILRVIVVEEMLHLTLSANVLNAVGGKPDLTQRDFVPRFPTFLPTGETDFMVDLGPFSRDTVDTFLRIERPGRAPNEESRLVRRSRSDTSLLGICPNDTQLQYYSIGEFYEEIARGLTYLHDKYGKELFTGDPGKQITPEYYYSGGGNAIAVTDMASAQEAIRLIIEQGEGPGGGIYDHEGELAHYFRFNQLIEGRYYQKGDKPEIGPSGPVLSVDWQAVYPIKTNARLTDYPEGSELHAAAVKFNKSYAEFLAFLTRAFNGEPQLMLTAVPQMFNIRDKMTQLMRNPIPGMPGITAAPTFEMPEDGGVKS